MTIEQLREVNRGLEDMGLENIESIMLIKEGATKGDLIKAAFPNAEVDADPYSPSVDIRCGGVLIMRVDRNVWNAPYKAGSEED